MKKGKSPVYKEKRATRRSLIAAELWTKSGECTQRDDPAGLDRRDTT
jgi:hypothetical protein